MSDDESRFFRQAPIVDNGANEEDDKDDGGERKREGEGESERESVRKMKATEDGDDVDDDVIK